MSECCNCRLLVNITNFLNVINNKLECIENLLSDLSSNKNNERLLAHNNPMTIAAEYPSIMEDKVVVNTPVRFLDMLNSDMYVIFKIDTNNAELPVYFKDSSNYEHRIVLPNSQPVLLSDLQLNGIYKAKYQYEGGYIILDNLTPINSNVITNN